MPYYYQNMYPNYMNTQIPQQTVPPAQQPSNGLNWVQGESGAKSFLVAPNATVMLMDSEADMFYIKSADASGMPLPLRTFEYKEVHAGGNGKTSAEYVTRKEYMELLEKYNEILERLGGCKNAKQTVSANEPKAEYDGSDKQIYRTEPEYRSERRSEQNAFFREDHASRI